MDINKLPISEQIKQIKKNPNLINNIKNQKENLQLEVIKQNVNNIKLINNPSFNIQKKVVMINSKLIKYINNPAYEVQLISILNDRSNEKYCKYPYEIMIEKAIKKNGLFIKYFKKPSKELIYKALKSNGLSIRFIDNLTEQMKREAVKQNGLAIKYIDNPSIEVQIEAINQNSMSIQYISNPSKYIQIKAIQRDERMITHNKCKAIDLNVLPLELQDVIIKENGLLIKYIKNPSLNMKITAVKENPKAIEFIDSPLILPDDILIVIIKNLKEDVIRKINLETNMQKLSLEVKIELLKIDGLLIRYLENPLFELQMEAVKQNCLAIFHIKNPTDEIIINAIKKNSWIIKDIVNPSKEVQKETVKQNGLAIQVFYEPTKDLQILAVQQNGWAIRYIDKPSLEVKIEAVKQNGTVIQLIKEPSLDVQLEAVRENGMAIKYIKDPPLKVQLEAIKQNDLAIQYIDKSTLPTIIDELKEVVYSSNEIKRKSDGNTEKKYMGLLDNYNATGSFTIINNKESVDAQLRYLSEFINIKNLYIASGFMYKSGLKLLEDIINRVKKKSGIVQLIIGSLQNYNMYKGNKENKSILGMDKSTANYINQLIVNNNVEIRTLEKTFYHGKFYFLEGEKKSCVIVGSSNVSNTAFNINRELNILYIFDNEDLSLDNFRNWFMRLWKECISVDVLDENYFNDTEIEYISNFSVEKLKQQDVINKINDLTDEQVKFRLNLWQKKSPDNIYTNLQIDSLSGYILFEFKQYNLLVFESFESGNAYYCFRNKGIEELLVKLKHLSKTRIIQLSDMSKRGYHINNKMKLENIINSMFIKKNKIKRR